MIQIKILCACGQKYAFDVDPANGQIPHKVNCPVCGADGTAAANEMISRTVAGEAPPAQAFSPERFVEQTAVTTPSNTPLSELRKPRQGMWIAVGIGAAVLAGAAGFFWWNHQPPRDARASSTSPASTNPSSEAKGPAARTKPPEYDLSSQRVTLPPEISSFIGRAERRSQEMAQRHRFQLSDYAKKFFATAKAGNLSEAEQVFSEWRQNAFETNAPQEFKSRLLELAVDLEICIEAFHEGNSDLVMALARDMTNSLTPGCVYFGGTNPGRGLPAMLCPAPGTPFFVVSQNVLAEKRYMEYLREEYGSRIELPTNDEFQRCINEYKLDAQERMKENRLKLGENVRVLSDPTTGQDNIEVSGQVCFMGMNALLTKVIFEKNPRREFYVEESFPLDWMRPHLTPCGIIMKLERDPVRDLTPEILRRDHEFWCQYSDRLVGNWITYDTPVSNLCAFVEKTYLRRDYEGFKGDPKSLGDRSGYVRREVSHLRSGIGGLYAWRLESQPEYRPKSLADKERLLKETEFAFKQAYAFYPYNPQPLYAYVNILLRNGRADEACMLAATSKRLDPENKGLDNLIKELDEIKKRQMDVLQGQTRLAGLEAEFRSHPSNVSNALQLANGLAQRGQTERVRQIADIMLTNAATDPTAVFFTVQVYAQLHDTAKHEVALQNWTKVNPSPEAWLDLAAVKTVLGKTPEALAAVSTCLQVNATRRASNPKAKDVEPQLRSDDRLKPLRSLPEFQQLLKTNR